MQVVVFSPLFSLSAVAEDPVPVVNGGPELLFLPNYLANPTFPYGEKGQGDGSPALATRGPLFPGPAACPPSGLNPPLTRQSQNGALPGPPATFQPLFFTGPFPVHEQELVLKVRIQNPALRDNDFIEVELNQQELTYQALLTHTCLELGVNPQHVERIRKLPNTQLRKDKDVRRLQNFQELELVLLKGDTTLVSAQTALTERPCYNPGAATLTY
uniref:ankyrin repeat domain-containing protein 40 n=1 Tax=Pristiophorus japonicus TaxID=55135 RepID=UPI00398E9510